MPSVDAVQYDTDREFHFVIDDYEIPEDTTDIRIYIELVSARHLMVLQQLTGHVHQTQITTVITIEQNQKVHFQDIIMLILQMVSELCIQFSFQTGV